MINQSPDAPETPLSQVNPLRQRAEERLRTASGPPRRQESPEDTARLLHELRVHEIELALQNEELRRAQEALEVSRARYFDLYDLAPVGYLILNERGLIRDANLAAARLLGLPRLVLIDSPLSNRVRPDEYERLYHCRQRLFETGERQQCELSLERPDGSSVAVQLDMSLGVERESGASRSLTMLTDISERKRAEAARQEEDRRKERFIAMLGHELRNPLAPIRHVAETLSLSASADPHQLQQAGDILKRQVGHLARLVDDLLDVARIGRGGIPLVKEPCDLRQAARCAAEQLQPLLEQSRQHLEMDLPERPVNLHGDPVRLAQAIANLLRNASQFSAPDTSIAMRLQVSGQEARLSIRDQGEGLDPAALERLFEPFSPAERTSESTKGGLGMGLALARDLLESHGGHLQASSAGPGQGCTFSARLPLPNQTALDLTPARQDEDPGPRRILVVEDNQDVADACVMLLQILGQEANAVPDGPCALVESQRLRPDLILIDLGLPGMDGFEVARRLRATEAGRRARLVALTGHGQDRERSRAAGFDEHLLKPMGLATLVALLDRCPSATSPRQENAGVAP